MKTRNRASINASSGLPRLASALLAAALVTFGHTAAAADTFRSWSYVPLPEGGYLMDGHSPVDDPSLWQSSSSVRYDENNFASSSIGFGSSGSLDVKIGVSARSPVRGIVHSDVSYRDDGFVCGGDACGTAVPLATSLDVRLRQDGSFTEGSANFRVFYSLWSTTTFYQFHFAVEQGEGPLRPYGWFSTENLVTGKMTVEDMTSRDASGNTVFNPLFNLVWDDANHDGIYNFAYDLSFTTYTQGVDLKEELSMSAYVYGSPDTQFVDSLNSFHSTWTPQAGVTLTGGVGGRIAAGPTLPVPEPSSWAMLLAGLGLTGLIARRRCAG
jgi:hypothetical protein